MISIRCLVENTAGMGSGLWGEHGNSFLIETPDGTVLFDTGMSGDVLIHNAEKMDIDLSQVDALALSHAHNDHTGGLEKFLAVSRPNIPLFANPDFFRDRYDVRDEQPKHVGLLMAPEALKQRTDLHLLAEPREIIPGVWTTGEVTDRPDFEGSSPHSRILVGSEYVPDPYLDDLSLVIETRQGLVLVCGCCHAGLLNTMAHVRKKFKGDIIAIIGGTHLAATDEEILEHAIQVIRTDYLPALQQILPNHCTGDRAIKALARAFGERVKSCPAGTLLTFEGRQ